MSARDIIASKLPLAPALKQAWADEILAALTASGHRILEPGELDGETIEACAVELDQKAAAYRGEIWEEWACSVPIAVRLEGSAAALRAMKDAQK